MKFPMLYKKTSTGAIQFWEIEAQTRMGQMTEEEYCPEIGLIVTKYGQLGTDSPQITNDTILKGKNAGKKNATTAVGQAQAEARAKWEKQKKKGYVERIDDAEADAVDALIEGGVVPMLAHKFADHAHKIKYPCYVQPKLDGIRCIAIVKDGACTLWSRTRKPITSCPHIAQELEALFENKDFILDGELYNHDFKSNFEHIVHLVRQDKPDSECTDVQYHIYDLIDDNTFQERTSILSKTIGIMLDDLEDYEYSSLRLVLTERVGSEDQVMNFFNKFKKQGYEGAMLRNADSKYVNKRSYDLQKVKEFDDGEFEITGIDEGRGKLAGHVGAFVCKTKDGKTFLAKMSGDTGKLADYFRDHSLWHGKHLTVQYQGLTTYGIPRFPVGIAIRDYE